MTGQALHIGMRQNYAKYVSFFVFATGLRASEALESSATRLPASRNPNLPKQKDSALGARTTLLYTLPYSRLLSIQAGVACLFIGYSASLDPVELSELRRMPPNLGYSGRPQ